MWIRSFIGENLISCHVNSTRRFVVVPPSPREGTGCSGVYRSSPLSCPPEGRRRGSRPPWPEAGKRPVALPLSHASTSQLPCWFNVCVLFFVFFFVQSLFPCYCYSVCAPYAALLFTATVTIGLSVRTLQSDVMTCKHLAFEIRFEQIWSDWSDLSSKSNLPAVWTGNGL